MSGTTVRELTTKLDFTTDDAGLRQYQKQVTSTLSKVQSQLSHIGKLFGASLALNFGREMFHSLAKTVRDANKIGIQLGQVLAPGTDVKQTLDDIFQIAQRTGEQYIKVAERFKTMAIAGKEFGVSQDAALKAVENIGKSLEVGRQSSEEQAQTFERLNMSLRRGSMSIREFGALALEAPIAIRTLGEALGKSEAQLREMAKTGKLTTDVLIKGFAQSSALLDKEFSEKALTLGHAFTYVYNEIIRFGQALWKGTTGVRYIAQAIVWLTRNVVSFGERAVRAIGGAQKAMELLQIAIAVAFSYYTTSLIISMTQAVIKLGAAGALASLKFLAIAAAFGAIVLIIEDIMVWMRGGESITGDLIGSFEDFGKTMERILEPFKAFGKLLEGDFSGAYDSLKGAFSEVDTGMVALIATALAVKAGFIAWNAISFAYGLVASIFSVTGATTVLSTGVGGIKAGFVAMNTLSFGPLIAALGPLLAALTPIIAAMAVIYAFKPSKVASATITDAHQAAVETAEAAGLPPPSRDEFVRSGIGDQASVDAEYQRIINQQAQPKEPSWIDRMAGWFGGGKETQPIPVVPTMPPGAMTPGLTTQSQTVTNNVPITNNVSLTVPADLGSVQSTVVGLVDRATADMAAQTARALTSAMPRMEAATG
jgi:tape measure domain-containing protein